MNIVTTVNQFNIDYIYFNEPIKNTIMNDGSFIKILYSTDIFVINGIYILIDLNNIITEKYFNKFKCNYDINNNKNYIEQLKEIEQSILNKASSHIYEKIGQCKIYEQLISGNIKIFSNNLDKHNNTIILKISGLWETDNNFGLTYKFIYGNN